MFDGAATAVTQQPCGHPDDRIDDGHPIRPAEQRVRRIMFGHFGFQCRAVGNVGRVGDDEVHLAVEFGKQPGPGDVGLDELDGRSCDVASGVGERVLGVVDGDDAGVGPVLRERHCEGAGARAQVDDQRALREWLCDSPFQQ